MNRKRERDGKRQTITIGAERKTTQSKKIQTQFEHSLMHTLQHAVKCSQLTAKEDIIRPVEKKIVKFSGFYHAALAEAVEREAKSRLLFLDYDYMLQNDGLESFNAIFCFSTIQCDFTLSFRLHLDGVSTAL